MYGNNPKYLDRQFWAKNVDPDQIRYTLYIPWCYTLFATLTQHFLDALIVVNEKDLLKF